MKFRTDFVTNSSSSSFILSFRNKNNDKLTIEDAYQVIYKLYLDYYNFVENVKNIVKSDPKSRMNFDRQGYLKFKNGKGRLNDDKNKEYSEKLQKQVGKKFDIFEANWKKVKWVPECPTYKDYVNYWTKKFYNISKINYKNNAPFSICDYRADTMDILHYRISEWDEKKEKMVYPKSPTTLIDKSLENSELSWFFPYIEDYIENGDFQQLNFEDISVIQQMLGIELPKGLCEDDGDNKDEYSRINKIRKETNDDGLFIERVLNGRFAILSESSYIPGGIVEKLREKCDYCSNHMG